ncbi:MAG: MGDG synthase family glycosyltransferase [Tumebacillaceae bacterium]
MPSTREKVLILSSDYGEGHQQAANAIRSTMHMHLAEVETLVVDFMEWTHPYLHSMSRSVFIKGVKKFPQIYGYLYRKTQLTSSFSNMFHSLQRIGSGRLLDLIESVQPTVVVSTFPLAAGAMSMLKTAGLTDVPTVTVITDHTIHSSWVHPLTDHYIVGSEQVRMGLQRLGLSDREISVTGIPIRPEFCQQYHRYYLRCKHELDQELPTVLVMGGGCGIIGDDVAEKLNQLPQQLQLIIVCGHNEKLRQQMIKEFKYSRHKVIITGYVDTVHELMALSDLMITKPGGLTTSEAIALELPMLLYKPLPGQEQDNARYLLDSGVAVLAENGQELTEKLLWAIDHPEQLSGMKDHAKRLNQKQSTIDALQVIMHTSHPTPLRYEEAYV